MKRKGKKKKKQEGNKERKESIVVESKIAM